LLDVSFSAPRKGLFMGKKFAMTGEDFDERDYMLKTEPNLPVSVRRVEDSFLKVRFYGLVRKLHICLDKICGMVGCAHYFRT